MSDPTMAADVLTDRSKISMAPGVADTLVAVLLAVGDGGPVVLWPDGRVTAMTRTKAPATLALSDDEWRAAVPSEGDQ